MSLLEDTVARIAPVDVEAAAAAQLALDAKTKPRGSLGRLEELAARAAAIRRTPQPGRLEPAIVVAAADHGVAAEGVSAYPAEVTRQMLANFEAEGAAVSVLARVAGVRVHVVDVGVGRPTGNIASGAAMTRADARRLVEQGIACARELSNEGLGIVALGEMGIGNSTVAAALASALLGVDAERVCGRGTGVAARLAPAAAQVMIAAHLSPEPGHRLVLDALELEPLLDLRLRLREGSGAALSLPLLDAALAVLDEMATFDAAGVTDAGR